jgi:hypothetical protein
MKEKGKFNPFATVLRPDEEILGVYEPEPITVMLFLRILLQPEYRRAYAPLVIALLVMLTAPVVCSFLWLSTVHQLFSVAVFVFTPIVLMIKFRNFINRISDRYPGRYMVTTQRVLTHESENASVVALRLEEVEDLRLIPSVMGGQSIVLRENSPYWNGLANPEDAFLVIKQAREDRLKVLAEVRAQ